MGLVGVVGALLGGLFPYAANTLIDLYGWRWTYVIFGAVLLGIMLPLGYIFTRDRPEDHGLLPDGAAPCVKPLTRGRNATAGTPRATRRPAPPSPLVEITDNRDILLTNPFHNFCIRHASHTARNYALITSPIR